MPSTKALENEAKNEDSITFEFDGVSYTVPAPKRWPLSIIRAQENNQVVAAAEKLLGPKQFKLFDPDEERVVEDLDNLFEALFKAAELDQGK